MPIMKGTENTRMNKALNALQVRETPVLNKPEE